jgi:hypothetical protein
MTRHKPASLLLLLLSACNRPGEDGTVASEEEGVPSDLPCGGANLETDDLNCGTCGNACNVMWPDTNYAAGGCKEGECGRTWTGIGPLPPPPEFRTCEELCSWGDIPCVPRGCSGLTAYVCVIEGDFGDQCNLDRYTAAVDFSGECDEPIPYPDLYDPETFIFVHFACCCGP